MGTHPTDQRIGADAADTSPCLDDDKSPTDAATDIGEGGSQNRWHLDLAAIGWATDIADPPVR